MKAFLLALVGLFPAPFRDHFGSEIRDQVARDYDAARAQGTGSAIWFTLMTALDLVRSAIAERLSPAPLSTVHRQLLTPMSALDSWSSDFRHAFRTLRRAPGFAAVVVGTLGLAIGINAGIFTVVQRVLLDPLPYHEPDELMYIAGTAPGSQLPPEVGLGTEWYVQFKDQSKLITGVAQFSGGTSTIRVADRVERVPMGFVTWDIFQVLGARTAVGRLPTAEDQNRVALISYATWQTWFGGDSSVIGRSYFVSDGNREIVGVLEEGVNFPQDGTVAYVPYLVNPTQIQTGRLGTGTVARIKPGVTAEALASEFTALSKRLPERFGSTPRYAQLIEQLRVVVRPLEEQALGRFAGAIWVLMAAVGIVLIIACFNVANLVLVRSEGRHREMALRQAIGAGHGQLMRLQLVETAVLGAGAGLLALVLARVTLPVLVAAAPSNAIPRLGTVHADWATVGFAAVAAALVAFACGIVPAIRAANPNLARLRESGRGATRRHHWARNGLVVGQTSLALVLLIGSGLLLRSYAKLSGVRPGYDTENIFTFQFAPQQPGLRTPPEWTNLHLGMLDRLKALPGVESVGIVENVPLDEGFRIASFVVEGEAADAANSRRMGLTFAGPGYFETMRIAVRAGRSFNRDDNLSNFGNAVISKLAAEKLWPGQDAIGRRFQSPGDSSWSTVVGVVDDVVQNDLRQPAEALVYYAMRGPRMTDWALGSPGYVVRSPRAEVIAPEIRAIVKEVAPEAPMYRTYTMDFLAKRSKVQLTFTMMTLGVVSALALMLGAIGLYGVLSFVVAERTKEIGVRMALGAEAGQVTRMVVGQGGRIVGAGVLIGVGVAFASTRALGTLLFGIPPRDTATFVFMSAMMVIIGLIASYVPARRASAVDPIESLRGD